MALTTRQQVKEVHRLLDAGGVMTLDQLTRLGLQRGLAAMKHHSTTRTTTLNRSPKRLTPTFVALEFGTLHRQPTSKLKHLALLADGTWRIGLCPDDWTVVATHASGATPDAVWVRGPRSAGMDWALEVDTTYPWSTVQRKFEDFGPPGLLFAGSLRTAARSGYLGVVWMVTNHLRQARVGEWLQATAGFKLAPPGPALPVGVQAYVWSGGGQRQQVWVVCAEL
jgi:hypothetical protein